jgi:hypothetical protein
MEREKEGSINAGGAGEDAGVPAQAAQNSIIKKTGHHFLSINLFQIDAVPKLQFLGQLP